MVANKAFIFLY